MNETYREMVELLLDIARDGGMVPVPAPTAIALCERWLAVEDAPVAEIDSSGDEVRLFCTGSELDNALVSAHIDTLHGQRVRIVPEGGGDGR